MEPTKSKPRLKFFRPEISILYFHLDIDYTAVIPQGKKPRLENVVAEWAKVMSKKLVQDKRVQQTVAKTLFGSKWEEGRGEETKRKVPFYKKIPGMSFFNFYFTIIFNFLSYFINYYKWLLS